MTESRSKDRSESDVESHDGDSRDNEQVVATSYVPQAQYRKWKQEADDRNMSISSLISSMVELGLNELEERDDRSSAEIKNLREKLAEARSDRDEAMKRLREQESKEFTTGLGRIKDLIIEDPGINRRKIHNHVSDNIHEFVNMYLTDLETSNFVCEQGDWYPPDEVNERDD